MSCVSIGRTICTVNGCVNIPTFGSIKDVEYCFTHKLLTRKWIYRSN